MKYEVKDWQEFKWIWEHDGAIPDEYNDEVVLKGKYTGERLEMHDALSVPNAPLLFPKTVNNIVKEAAEPMLIGARLLQRINYKYGQTITFPAVGAIDAEDIPEGGEYPERSLDMGGATVVAQIGKSGLAVKLTEEMIRYSQFDVMAMHLRAAGRALARHKEKKIFNYIRRMGTVAFDNRRPTQSMFGVTHGRSLNGQPNGSLTVDDIFDAWGAVVMQGFTPNTMLLHPLTWTMFVKDPVLRAFAMQNGGGVFLASWTGNPAGQAPWANSSMGKLGISPGQKIIPGTTGTGANAPHGLTPTPTLQYPQNITSAPQLPSYMNIPLLIIVTPFVWFDARRKLTDIYLFDRNELGALIVDEEINSGEWTDPARDLVKVKMRERYAIAILNEGQAIATIRNVAVRPNEIVLPARTTMSVSGAVTAIDPATAIV